MEVPCDLLLHPELLTNEQLKHVIRQRCLRIPNLESMPRDEILQVFHQFCVPYGQRKCKDSGRGKVLNKTRHIEHISPPKMNIMTNSQSRKICLNRDRIKPPPDLLSGHMKKIKLENKPAPVKMDVCSSSKRKMDVDPTSPRKDAPTPAKKERKPITWP